MAKSTTTPAKAKKAAPKKTAPKKAAVKTAKPAKKEPSINIKYTDKSAGQPELVVIFDNIKKMLKPYDKKRSLVLHSKPSQANLVSHKPVVIAGRERDALWFVSALVQKGYVGLYYMPVYMRDEMKKHFSPEFLKCLKGKACFHISKNDPAIMAEIKKAIKIGYEGYIERGWL